MRCTRMQSISTYYTRWITISLALYLLPPMHTPRSQNAIAFNDVNRAIFNSVLNRSMRRVFVRMSLFLALCCQSIRSLRIVFLRVTFFSCYADFICTKLLPVDRSRAIQFWWFSVTDILIIAFTVTLSSFSAELCVIRAKLHIAKCSPRDRYGNV